MIRALVFDFDGLILETELPVYESWRELFDRYGLELPFEKWALNIGTAEETFDPVEEFRSVIDPHADLSQILTRRLERELELIGDGTPLPGVTAYLREARQMRLKIGLASSSSCRWVEGHLKRLGLRDYFEVLQAKDDVAVTKPDPALYRSTVDLLGVLPREASAFEDSANGVLSAKRAGLYCVAVPNTLTRRTDISQADLVLGSLEELSLQDLIRQIEGISKD
jgi:HAD superfamily hydrolase (TIGR01509 family)